MLDRLIDACPYLPPLIYGSRLWARAVVGILADLLLRPDIELTERGRVTTI